MLEAGKLDLIFTTQNIQNEMITSEALFEETMVVISKEKISLSEIHQQRWIVFHEEDYLLELYKTPSKDLIYLDSITAMVRLVKNGVGIAVVPDHFTRKSDKLHTLEITLPHLNNIYMASLNYKLLPQYLTDLIGLVKQKSKFKGLETQ